MDQIRIVFLGTGAGAPSLTRNVASVVIVLDGRVLMFDCGEGTQHQLLRSGVRGGALEAIFISHLHGDHLYGLPGLLASLNLADRKEPLAVYGPKGIAAYLEGVMETTRFRPRYELLVEEIDQQSGIEREIRRVTGYRIVAAALDHSVTCFGFALIEDDRPGLFDAGRARALGVPEGPLFGRLQRGEYIEVEGRLVSSEQVVGPRRPGRRIAYCTDTRPCDAAVGLAQGADVLIHEATYGNDLTVEADDRFHSTAEEAARVAARAGARHLVLTHFSPRYVEIEPLVEEARRHVASVEAAADLMAVQVPRG